MNMCVNKCIYAYVYIYNYNKVKINSERPN